MIMGPEMMSPIGGGARSAAKRSGKAGSALWHRKYDNGRTVWPGIQVHVYNSTGDWQLKDAPNAMTTRFITSNDPAEWVAAWVSDSIIIPNGDFVIDVASTPVSMTGKSWIFFYGDMGRVRVINSVDNTFLWDSNDNSAGTHHILVRNLDWTQLGAGQTLGWRNSNTSNCIWMHCGLGRAQEAPLGFRSSGLNNAHSNAVINCSLYSNLQLQATLRGSGAAADGNPIVWSQCCAFHKAFRFTWCNELSRVLYSGNFVYNGTEFNNCGSFPNFFQGSPPDLPSKMYCKALGAKKGPGDEFFQVPADTFDNACSADPTILDHGHADNEISPSIGFSGPSDTPAGDGDVYLKDLSSDYSCWRANPADESMLVCVEPFALPEHHQWLPPGNNALQAELYQHMLDHVGPTPFRRTGPHPTLIADMRNGVQNYAIGNEPYTWGSDVHNWDLDPAFDNFTSNPDGRGRTKGELAVMDKGTRMMHDISKMTIFGT